MPEEIVDAQVASSSTTDAQAGSSPAPEVTAQPQGSEQTPPLTSPPEGQKPWNMPPEDRWNEVLRERDEARRAFQDLAARVSQPQVPVQPASDPWEGLVNHPDPATAQFWQQQYKLQRPIVEKVQGLERAVETGTQELAALRVENFRLKNPDILPDSPEEQAIAAYVKAGYPLDVARKAGMFDLHYGKLKQENETLRGRQGAIPQKIAANATDASSGIPATSGLPKPPMDWRERARQAYRKGGGLVDVINAAGARPAT